MATHPLPGFTAAPATIAAVVVRSEPVAASIRLIEISARDGRQLSPSAPGAHIGIILPDGTERSYSLVRPDEAPAHYVIAVKLEAEGRGGSRYVHQLAAGDDIIITEPRNHFPLDEEAPVSVLIAGGIGISPLWNMAQRLDALGRDWVLHYACRSRTDAAFHDTLAPLAGVHFHFDEDHDGRPLPIADIVAGLATDTHIYCCGPLPMLAAIEAAVAGRPAERIHVEYFAPKEAAATNGGFIVKLGRSGGEVPVKPGQTVLKALRNHGVEVPFSCEEGTCGACEVRVLAGRPDHRDTVLTDEERAESLTMMVCCSGSCTPTLTLDL